MKPPRPASQFAMVWRFARERVDRLGLKCLLIVALAIAAGAAEAFSLATVARGASAAFAGDESLSLGLLGQASLPMSLALAAGTLVIVAALQLLSNRLQTAIAQRTSRSTRADLSAAFLAADWPTQQSQASGRLQEYLGNYATRAGNVVDAMGAVTSGSVLTMSMLVSCLLLAPAAVGVGVLVAAVVVTGLRPLRRRSRQAASESAAASASYAELVAQETALVREIRMTGTTTRAQSRLTTGSERLDTAVRRVRTTQKTTSVMYQYCILIVGILSLAAATSLLSRDELGDLGAVVIILLRALSYSQQVVTGVQGIVQVSPFVAVISTELDHYRQRATVDGTRDVPLSGGVELRGVSYDYPDREGALRDITFTAHPGEIIGVVGRSGAGKSTLAALLTRLLSPTDGELLLGGVRYADVRWQSWVDSVAFVPQDVIARPGTLRENILFDRTHSDSSVDEAVDASALRRDVGTLPDQLGTLVGVRGAKLSGGQLQRLGLARAFVGAPRLLVLDEATSALDVHSEAAVQQAIIRLRGSVTTFVIAHRPSTIRIADRLMVLEGGRLVAHGTVPEVAAENAYVADMLDVVRQDPDAAR